MDKIHIRDLHLKTVIGTFPEEREIKQDVIINIELHCSLFKAGHTDRLEDTVDYKMVKRKIIELVEGASFFLVEKLAEEISQVCLKTEGVKSVRVIVDKPNALKFARSVAVEIERPTG